MTTFALVHGAWHGAWCWERLVPEIEHRGHRAVAVELPCDDASATFTSYADVVVAAIADEDDDVVLVGHSLAGLTIPIVAERRPVSRLIYVAALVPVPGKSFVAQLRAEPGMFVRGYERGLRGPDGRGRFTWVDFGVAHATIYSDCDEAVARDAFARLRPQATAPYTERCPLERLPGVPSTSLVCVADRVVSPEWSRRAARERLGVEPIELPAGTRRS